jgi:ABC-type sugar transport system ATPase subunit
MIRIENLCLTAGEFRLDRVSLEVPDDQYFVLLGPPGSGKTLLLEALAGLRRIDSGRIHLDNREVTRLEPRQRRLGYVPQDYALFPHLSVRENILFGLRAWRVSSQDHDHRLAEAAEMIGITPLLGRRTNGLSGGERQRVALARALIMRPKVLLLDEPVSALDESTRQDICRELRQLQRQLGITAIHVSHQLEEAMSVADQAGILHAGVFQQIGPLDELLRHPANEFVAGFLRAQSLMSGQAVGPGTQPDTTAIRFGDQQLDVPGRYVGEVTLLLRPGKAEQRRHKP